MRKAYIVLELLSESATCSGTLNRVTIENRVLRELHRASLDAGRRGIAIPSVDLEVVARATGNRMAAEQALNRLAQANRVARVRRDLVVLPDVTGLLGVDLVDLVDVVAPKPCLITGGRALAQFDLTDQHFFGLAVLVPAEIAKMSWRGQTATFYKTDRSNIWGADPDTRPCYALPQRAIVDALNHPRYGVTTIQALDALLLAASKDPGFLDRLHEAVARYSSGSKGHGSRAAARRVGLVVDRFVGAQAAEPYLDLIGPNRTPVLLRPGGPDSGTVDHRWRVKVNAVLEPETAR